MTIFRLTNCKKKYFTMKFVFNKHSNILQILWVWRYKLSILHLINRNQLFSSFVAKSREMLRIGYLSVVAFDSLASLISFISKLTSHWGPIRIGLCINICNDLYHPFSNISCLHFDGIIRYEAGIKIKFKHTTSRRMIKSVSSSLSSIRQ